MALPQFSMRELIEAGVHFGHKTKRWNPRMAPFLYGVRNDVHIIDLQQTVPMLHQALQAARDAAAKGGRVLFVGTKRQATDPVAEAATRCGQYYINQRWLGGMLTNWKTIQVSIKTLRQIDDQIANPGRRTKKEILSLSRQKDKLEKSLGGIKEMGGLPDLIFIIDTNKEDLAVKEAARLNIPVVAVVDSNSSLDGVTYPIPGNDDATRAIKLYLQLFSDAVLDGLQESLSHTGADLGAREEMQFDLKSSDDKAAEEKLARSKGKKSPAVVVKKQVKLKDEPSIEDEPEGELETESKKGETAAEGSKAVAKQATQDDKQDAKKAPPKSVVRTSDKKPAGAGKPAPAKKGK